MALGRKPELPDGFLGAQPKFSELNLETDSHKDAEFRVIGENNVVIKMQTGVPVKVVTKLTNCFTDKEIEHHVLVQRKDNNSVYFYVSFPTEGWYKLMIFAQEESSTTESLPNVYNYLIAVENLHQLGQPYVKAYTKFYKDYCFLEKPLFLNSNSHNQDDVTFKMVVPGAHKVAVHCGEEWFQLVKKGDHWEGKPDLAKYRALKQAKVTVSGNYENDGNSYSVLLEYII